MSDIDSSHYRNATNYMGRETIDNLELMGIGFEFCLGNLVKYTDRMGTKPGVSLDVDAEKALWYARRALALNLRDPESDHSFQLDFIINSLLNNNLSDARARVHRLITRVIENNSLD